MIFVCVLRTLKIYSVSKFQESNTVLLTIVTMLYIRSAELSLQNWNFLPLTNITIFPILPCPPPQQPFYSLLFQVSVQFNSVTQSCLTLCDPMNRSIPGLPVHHQLPEFTQTHVHRDSDAIQPSHPLSSPSPPAPNPPSIRVFSNESPLHMR